MGGGLSESHTATIKKKQPGINGPGLNFFLSVDSDVFEAPE